MGPLPDADIPVVVVRNTPTPNCIEPECIERAGPDSPDCALSRAEADQQSDPQVTAAQEPGRVQVIDLTDHLCNQQTCPAVVGNVPVYRDNHLTDTFALSLAPALEPLLAGLV